MPGTSSDQQSSVDVEKQYDLSKFELKKTPWQPNVTPLADLIAAEYSGSGTEVSAF